AARSASPSEVSRCASNPKASNSSHFISHFPHSAKVRSSRHAGAAREIAQHFQLREQQGTPAMQPRTNRSDRASRHQRSFFVTQFFQLAQNHGFAKFRWQIHNR